MRTPTNHTLDDLCVIDISITNEVNLSTLTFAAPAYGIVCGKPTGRKP